MPGARNPGSTDPAIEEVASLFAPRDSGIAPALTSQPGAVIQAEDKAGRAGIQYSANKKIFEVKSAEVQRTEKYDALPGKT
ncbi:hypothetical protein NDU88_004589 [Pleurodeles waltl]|uniref:Uncharacterized protein n=1 Tax=Pleurodeles waltl TaxID=8319 RepID=A0AAV7PD95_PLEWA|nr:hypothetical protein NDU88_004589 [Pleurodeles waltl]